MTSVKFWLTCLVAMAGLSAQAQSAQTVKMVVTADGDACKYLGESSDKYHVMGQDDGWVDKKTSKIEFWSAAKGKGWVCGRKGSGTVNIRQRPSTQAPVVGRLERQKNSIPDPVKCLGVENGWYKVSYNGTTGYVKASVAYWSARPID